MPVIKIPTPFRYYTDGQVAVTVAGQTVGAAMSDLVTRFPALKTHLYKTNGELRAFVNLFIAGNNIKDLQGLDTPLGDEDEVKLVPSIAGGSPTGELPAGFGPLPVSGQVPGHLRPGDWERFAVTVFLDGVDDAA